ncbi:tRNA-Phe hydroxylase [Aureococcus anophagefferens]|nr:tRNA-Phe hydroxylase [Aureococcus anophagefferens]
MAVIEERYKRLFEVNDPANGGSFYLQSKVYRAHEALVSERKPIGAEAKTALWALFDGAAWRVALPRPGADAALDAFLAARGLSYSQAARQWSLFQRAARRRSDADALGLGAHAHADSLHAHRRRAFSAARPSTASAYRATRPGCPRRPARSGCPSPRTSARARGTRPARPTGATSSRRTATGQWALGAGGRTSTSRRGRGRRRPRRRRDAPRPVLPGRPGEDRAHLGLLPEPRRRRFGRAAGLRARRSTSEAEAIEARLPAFVESLRAVDLSALAALKAAPLAPIFVARVARGGERRRRAPRRRRARGGRDAARAAERVRRRAGRRLRPPPGLRRRRGPVGAPGGGLWRHADELLASTDERDAARRVAAIAKREPGDTDSCSWVAENLAVGGRRAGRPPGCWAADAIVNVTLDGREGMGGPGYLQVPVAEGKKDRRGLEAGLPGALRFAAAHLAAGRRVLVHCAQGRDRSVAVAVALLAACFDERGDLDAARATALAAAADDADLRALVALGAAGKRRLLAALHRVAAARPDAPRGTRSRSFTASSSPLLISSGDHGAAVDLSFALDELRASRELPADCHADAPFVGSADVTVEIKAPRRRGDPRRARRRPGRAAPRRRQCHAPSLRGAARGPAWDEPVVGAVVDGVFVTSDRHAPARRRPRRVDDKYSKKIAGDKTMLVTVICPSSEDCDTVYDYEVIASDHDGDVISYLEEVVAVAQDFWTANSWGNFTVDVTITPILEVDYDQSVRGQRRARLRVEYVEPYDDDEAPLCNPCTYTIQGTDTGRSTDYPVALQVSTATDDQFLFVEYRSSQGGALLTYSGFSYTSGMSGKFGNTRMVDCDPSTTLLTDGLGDGDSIILDVGDASTSRPMSAYFEVVGDYLEVSLYSSDTPRPTLSMAPTTAAPTTSPSKEDDQCGKEKYCCDVINIDGYETFSKIRDDYYLHISAGGQYYMTTSEPCYESGSISYIATVTDDELVAYCEENQPWYKDGSPDKGCDWVAEDLERCDKEDSAGVTGRVGCDATCYECEAADDDSEDAVAPAPTAHECVADSTSWYKDGSPDKGCDWVAEDLERCDSKEDSAGVTGRVGCDAAYQDGSPDKDCAWVSEDLDRCDKEDADGVTGSVGCDATPAPTPEPTDPPSTGFPTPWPSLACDDEYPLHVSMILEPDAASWDTVSWRSVSDTELVGGGRPRGRIFKCVDDELHCWTMTFTLSDPDASAALSFTLVSSEGSRATWGFEGGQDTEEYYYCMEGGVIDAVPTPTPTVSVPPTSEPAPAPTALPSYAPTTEPTPSPTPQPSPEPTITPGSGGTKTPTAAPSMACDPDGDFPLSVTQRLFPDGDSWSTVSWVTTSDGEVVETPEAPYPDRRYICISDADRCFEVTFSFEKSNKSADLSYSIGVDGAAPSEYGFRGGEDEEKYYCCIVDGVIAAAPTAAPSVTPGPRPSPRPAEPRADARSVAGAVAEATPAPTPEPTAEDTVEPTRAPTTVLPTPVPSHFCNGTHPYTVSLTQIVDEPPHDARVFKCVDDDYHCWDLEFSFANTSLSSGLSFQLTSSADSETRWTFRGGEDTETFYYCIVDGIIDAVPTPGPTVSVAPTSEPVPAPTLLPSYGPTIEPTRGPTGQPTCEDYVSKKSKNCKLKDDFKVKAQDACPVTCGECVVPTLAPTPRPSSAEPTPECHDSVSWWSKKSKNDCDYVAKDADGRCGNVDESDVAAEVACPEACGYCGTFSICADSTSWYYKKSRACEDYEQEEQELQAQGRLQDQSRGRRP